MSQRKSHEPMVILSVNDPAIDRHSVPGQTALKNYVWERDASKLVLLEGAQPRRFWCKPIRNQARTWLESIPAESLKHLMAFCASIDHVENVDWWQKKERTAGWSADAIMADRECVDELADELGGKMIEEIGAIALQRANLSVDQKKAYWLPLGCEVDYRIGSPATAQPRTSEPESESN